MKPDFLMFAFNETHEDYLQTQSFFEEHREEICGRCNHRIKCLVEEKINPLFCLDAMDLIIIKFEGGPE